ncbi:hypothetical protein D3C79_362330 [compost metagenome]
MVANLVVHRVELDIGALVDTRAVGGERRCATEVHARQAFAAGVLTDTRRLGQALATVVHARLVERSAGGRQRAIGAECLGNRQAAGDQRIAGVLGLGVELHGRLLDIGALFRQVDRLGFVHHLGEVQLGGGGHRFATGSLAVQGVTP